MLNQTEFSYDEIHDFAPGSIFHFQDLGQMQFVDFGTLAKISDRISREEVALQEADAENEVSQAFLIPKKYHPDPKVLLSWQNLQQDVDGIRRNVASLKRKRSSRRLEREVIEAAVVDLDGIETNLNNFSRAELNRLSTVSRQKLGTFPAIQDLTSDQIIATLEPIILKAFRECNFGLFVSILSSYLLERPAMVKSFMPPMGIHFRKSAPKSKKLKSNNSFVTVFKFFALFFGGCVFDAETQFQWLENLRGRFNAKVDHMVIMMMKIHLILLSLDIFPHFIMIMLFM